MVSSLHQNDHDNHDISLILEGPWCVTDELIKMVQYLASGWLFCFILETEYILKFVYFLLVLIDCSKSPWISRKLLNITIPGNILTGQWWVDYSVKYYIEILKIITKYVSFFGDMTSVTDY